MTVDWSLFSGSMTMLVLKLLEEQDLYGYEMISILKEKSNNVFELRTGILILLYKDDKEKLNQIIQERWKSVQPL